MAHQLQKIVALFLFCAGAAAAPFSHAVHLKLKLACATCHAAAARSTRVADNLLPPAAICAGCHRDERGKTIKQPRRLTVDKFNHQVHARGSACIGCHRGLETSNAVSVANFPLMAECLVCHNRIEPPYSCEKCHVDIKALTPPTHDAKWTDTHTDPKIAKEGCAICHGRRFVCQGCH